MEGTSRESCYEGCSFRVSKVVIGDSLDSVARRSDIIILVGTLQFAHRQSSARAGTTPHWVSHSMGTFPCD